MLVGRVPVPYDATFRCAFPQILEAVLHFVPPGTPPPSTADEPHGKPLLPSALLEEGGRMGTHARHVVSLHVAEEPKILEAVHARLHRRTERRPS